MTNNTSYAFPILDNAGDGILYCRSGGMSLRDYFAAHIAAGMSAYSGTSGISYGPDDIAGRSYQVADAMLAHRGQSDER